jgi:hypothetical protein
MPPKSIKRAKRHSPSSTESAKAVVRERAAADTSPVFSNFRRPKVLELPLELLMEIISYFECLPVPMIASRSTAPYIIGYSSGPSRYLERTDALRLLSQTCKLWRHIFFPLLWERLEPCLTHSESGAWYKVYGESLIRKSSLVCETPHIALHVRCV